MGEPTPTVGRMVHFTSHGSPVLPDGTQKYPSIKRAAVITEISPDQSSETGWRVGLMVINPEGVFFKQDVSQGEGAGQWNWPERI